MIASRFFSCVLLPALLLAGCRSGSNEDSINTDPSSTNQEGNAKPTKGGFQPARDDTLAMYYSGSPDTLNLITASDSVSDAFHRPVYEYLARRTHADPMKWEPQLATSWEFDEESLEFTIHLRKGVMWHPIKLPNGKELPAKEFTARDVKFTFDCILNEFVEAASIRSYYVDADEEDPEKRIKIKVNVVDKYTVKIKWNKPYFQADDYSLMAQIMPRHVYSVDENGEPPTLNFASKEFADLLNNHWANDKMCGTGPMMLKEYIKDDRAVFVRNPNYWGDPFYFSQIVYRHITNSNTARQKMLNNDLDWAAIPQIDHYLSAKEHKSVLKGRVTLREYNPTSYRYMGYNLQRKIFADKKVRVALGYATPVDEIISKIYHGMAARMTGPFLPGGPFSNPDVKPLPHDLEKAKKLLAEAGWEDTNENGILDKEIDGQRTEFRFDVLIFADSPQYLSIAELIKERFRQAGIDITISPTKWDLFLTKLNKKEFDAMILGWVSDWKSDPFQLWHSSQADLPDSSNFGYKNPEVDALIEELRITLDEDRQKEIYYRLHEIIYEDQPYTFLYSEAVHVGTHSRLKNIHFYRWFRPHVDYREWGARTARVQGE